MKKVIIILCILPLCFQAFAQDYWQMVHPPTVGPGLFDVSTKGNVFVVWENQLQRSSNNGLTWDSITTAYVCCGGFNSSPTGVIYLLSNSLIKSTDEGNTWINLTSPITPLFYGPTILETNSNGDIFLRGGLGNERFLLYRSTDEGNTWEEIGIDSSMFIDIAFKDNLTFASVYHYDAEDYIIYKSYDNGNNWERLINSPSDIYALLTAKNGNLYCGRRTGLGNPPRALFKSTDDGLTWQADSNFTTSGVYGLVENQFGHIFATTGHDVYKSTDDGDTWEQINSGTMPPDGYQIGVDSSGYVYVIASLNQTLYRSVYSTIPVELVSFSAKVIDNGIQINWQTASELNNLGFEIERKTTESGWRLIGYKEGYGTTTEKQYYTFIDENISMGKYFYRLKQYDYDGTFEYSNIIEVEALSLNNYSLEQNFPNPFNPTTKIKFNIPSTTLRQTQSDDFVTLKVYDVLGNEVETLVNEEKPTGVYEVEFDATSLTSGIYFYKLQADFYIETKKMVLMK